MTFNCITFDANAFWTAMSAIATLLMAIATFVTLRQNHKQLDEMKRQWEEEHRPKLDITLVHIPYDPCYISFGLEIRNIGKELAKNVSFNISQSFIDEAPIKSIKDNIIKLQSKEYRLLPEDVIVLPIIKIVESKNLNDTIFGQVLNRKDYDVLLDFLKKRTISVSCKYQGNKVYYDEFTLSTKNVANNHYSIQEALSNISIQLVQINNSIRTNK